MYDSVDELALEVTAEGIRLPVRAQPKARRNGLTGIHDAALKVAVTQAPEKGKANAALVKVLASQLGLSRVQIQLVAGETSSRKSFLISEIDEPDLRRRIAAALDG